MSQNSIFLISLLFISFLSLYQNATLFTRIKMNSLQGTGCSCTSNSSAITPPIVDPILPPPIATPDPTKPWIGDSWTNTQMGFTVVNGVFTATSPSLIRYLNSVRTVNGVPSIDLITIGNNVPNVQRIMRLFKQSDWNYLFPVADPVYTYQTFLQAAAKFPAFCNERAAWLTEDMDNLCKKEMITMWAHWAQETGAHTSNQAGVTEDARQALYYLNEMGCSVGCDYTSSCSGWIQEAFPCATGKKYFGRGSKQVSYNFNYGPFSKVLFGDVTVLLNDPDRVSREGWLAVASGFWFFMTPQSPKPSIHEIITGFWVPNTLDKAAGFSRGFGTTINVINGGSECGLINHPQAVNRIRYFQFFANYLGVTIGADEVLNCEKQPSSFVSGGNGTVFSYWDSDWNAPTRCQLVSWQTGFAFLFPDSYTKCIQKNVLGLAVTA